MSKSVLLSNAIQSVLDNLDPVIASLRKRPDYDEPQIAIVATLTDFKQGLLNLQLSKSISTESLKQSFDFASKTVMPLLLELITANTALMKMGQLNLKRTIPPEMAKIQNGLVECLQASVQIYVATSASVLDSEDSSEPDAQTETPFDAPRDEREMLFSCWIDTISNITA